MLESLIHSTILYQFFLPRSLCPRILCSAAEYRCTRVDIRSSHLRQSARRSRGVGMVCMG